MKKRFDQNWPLFVTIMLFFLSMSVLLLFSLSQTNNHLTYTVDDAYIHMAMAKNVANHNIWGITQHGFTSSSSSLLWTSILALTYKIFGVHEVTPFLLNILFSVGFIFLFYRILTHFSETWKLEKTSLFKRDKKTSWIYAGMGILICGFSILISPQLVANYFSHDQNISILGLDLILQFRVFFLIAGILLITLSLPNFWEKSEAKRNKTFLILALTIFIIPLHAVIMTGMEHMLHVFLVTGFVFQTLKVLSKENFRLFDKNTILMMIWLPFLSACRYESLFIIAVLILLLIFRKKWMISIISLFLAVIPILIYGIISVKNGWFFLPNSVLLKGNFAKFHFINEFLDFALYAWYNHLYENPHMVFILLTGIVLFIREQKNKSAFWSPASLMLTLFLSATLLHLQFAQIGWFFRYEAYLLAMAAISFSLVFFSVSKSNQIHLNWDWKKLPKTIALIILTIIVFIYPVGFRTITALIKTPIASRNIFEQHYQMGLFLKKFYTGQSIAAHDIGAINYLADIKCLDLWGLSSLKVADKRLHFQYNTEAIRQLTDNHESQIAIIYDHWIDRFGGIPREWEKVGEWQIINNYVCGHHTVSFYAVNPEARVSLERNLQTYSSQLPDRVQADIAIQY